MSEKKKATTQNRGVAKARASAEAIKGKSAAHTGGFLTFIREQGVVGLAVGLAIGTAAGASVKAIVDNFISPLVALMTQGVDLKDIKSTVELGNGKAEFGWGLIISSLITLLATALVIYVIVRVIKLDRIDKKKD